jgi:hypothetical protein
LREPTSLAKLGQTTPNLEDEPVRVDGHGGNVDGPPTEEYVPIGSCIVRFVIGGRLPRGKG